MVDQDILIEKTAIIQRCLSRIKDITGLDPTTLEELNTQDIFVLNVQRAVQAAIDLAAHIITDRKLGIPGSLKEHFTILTNSGILDRNLSTKLEAMVGFRNIAVHDYQTLDLDILKSILTKDLHDLEEFYRILLIRFQDTNQV